MNTPRDRYSPDFIVVCVCGTEFHTDDAHVGKRLRCQCGRIVVVARPSAEWVPPEAEHREASQARRRRRSHREPAFVPIVPVRRPRWRRWRSLLTGWTLPRMPAWRTLPRALGRSVTESLRNLQHPRPVTRWAARLSWGYLALLLVSWVGLITLSESFVPAMLLAYGPRMFVLLPLVVLLPVAVVRAHASLWPLVVALCIGVHSIMGFRVSWQTLVQRALPATHDSRTVRVLTFNVLEGGRLAYDLQIVLKEYAPDLVAFQECGQPLWDALSKLPNWYTNRLHGLCTASRWPIRMIDSMPRQDLLRVAELGAGGTGLAVRLTLDTPKGPLVFVNVHLETVRKGLNQVISSEGFLLDNPLGPAVADNRTAESISRQLKLNAFIRKVESSRASVWAAHGERSVPLLVVGDFNLPVESPIFRQNWSHMIDAFESSGTGFGWTKREGRFLRVRIDHILVNGVGLKPVRAVVGEDYDSDHLPVIADLQWK